MEKEDQVTKISSYVYQYLTEGDTFRNQVTKKCGTGVFLRNLIKTIEVNWGVFGCILGVFGVDLLLPPVQGWEYYDNGKWESNPTMECSREVLPASL